MKRKQPERKEQAAIIQLLRSVGAATYVIGTTRPRTDSHHGTCQTPGLPDVLAFIPTPCAPSLSRQVWFEVKAPAGRMSPFQEAFRANCRLAGVAHVVGGLDAAIAFLTDGGWLKADSLPHYKQPVKSSASAERE